MPPVVGFIVAAVGTIGSVISAIGGFTLFGVAVGRILLTVGLNMLFSKLFAPPKQSVGERQASVLELSLGEVPREAIMGRAATGGSLLDAFNHGPKNEYEDVVIALADHICDALEGYYVNDKYYAYTGPGLQNYDDFKENGNSLLYIDFMDGSQPGPLAALITTSAASGESEPWNANDIVSGVAYARASYHFSQKVWSAGRPRIRFVLRGYKCYDARKDSTVLGGSGSHRFEDPLTHEWSENAYVCRYNFIRGIRSRFQLMVGPGRSAEEEPPETMIAPANICDELVPLPAADAFEPRYRCSAVIRANERWIDVEENFAAAMGGALVERAGVIGVDVGAAKTPVFEFTDADLLRGLELNYQAKVSRDDLVNTIVTRYVDPDQLWEEASAPVRRSLDDITADGEERSETLQLLFVTSQYQAQRLGEIKRRRARYQASAIVPLGPKFMMLEDGDWGTWTSARRFGGGTRTFEVQGVGHDEGGRVRLALKQISADIFPFARINYIDVERPRYLKAGAPTAATVDDFDAVPYEITGGVTPAMGIRTTWTPPTDGSVTFITLEYRVKGAVASTKINVDPDTGTYDIPVLPVVDVNFEVRATPVVRPKRDVLTTAWREVPLEAPLVLPTAPNSFHGVHSSGDLITFIWSAFPDPTYRYEIRQGETFALGRVVASNVPGGSVLVNWPLSSTDGQSIPFWIKTQHRSGLYSEDARLWLDRSENFGARNFVLEEDYGEDEYPGVLHRLTRTTIGDDNVLELDSTGGFSAPRGDYYVEFELNELFKARCWLEQRANAFLNDTPEWADADFPWDEAEGDWEPELGDAGAANLQSFIAPSRPEEALTSDFVDGFRFNDTLDAFTAGADPLVFEQATTFEECKTANGVRTGGDSALWYEFTLPASGRVGVTFDMRLKGDAPAEDRAVITLSNAANDWLGVVWDASAQAFVLEGSFGSPVSCPWTWTEDDVLSISLWQSETERGLIIASQAYETPFAQSVELAA